jgi:hypothetical protein
LATQACSIRLAFVSVETETGKNAGGTQRSQNLFLGGQIRTFSDIAVEQLSAMQFAPPAEGIAPLRT